MKTTVLRLLLLVMALGLVLGSVALAEDEKEEAKNPAKDSSKMNGKELFKTYCKSCHGEDAEAGEYTPMYLIIEQWERFFDEDYVETHGEVTDPNFEDGKITEIISDDMLEKIRDFCIEGAADGEHPMTCG